MQKLIDASELIKYRESVKPHEAKRIQDAFSLIAESPVEGTSQAIERRNGYRWLLKKVQEAVGPQFVTLCAVGLGQSAIGGARDRVRLEFLAQIKDQEETLKSSALQKLADEYDISCLFLLTPLMIWKDLTSRSQAGFTGCDGCTRPRTGQKSFRSRFSKTSDSSNR